VEDWVLAMNISNEDAEGTTILFMDNTFTMKKLKLDEKNGAWRLKVLAQSAKPMEQIENIWNRLSSVTHS
jgi:hypothetical protein